MVMAIAASKRNTRPIRSINGKAGQSNLNTNESGMVRMATQSAASALILFQNNPKQKMTTTPGVTKPVNSCIY